LRAAAIVIIATGVNDVIAGARPAYEPLYVYLAAIALVVWLDGVLLGALAALVAVAFYALLFFPPNTASTALFLPLGASFATIAVVGVVRGMVRARQRRTAEPVLFPRVSQALLAPAPAAVDHTQVLSAIDELRDELHAAVFELTAAREREAATQQAYADAREALAARLHQAEEESARRAAEADRERAERTHLETAARTQADESTRLLTEARDEAASLVARVTELELARSEGEVEARQRVDTARAEVGRLRGAVEAAHAELVTQSAELAALRATHEREAQSRAGESEALRTRLGELQKSLAEARTGHARDSQSQTELETLLAAERARVAETASALEEERAAREALRERLTEVQATFERVRDEAEAHQTEAATLRTRVEELERELAAERTAQAVAVAEFDGKLSTIVTHLAEDHEADLGRAMEEKEEARAEARALTVRMTTLQRKVEEEQQHVTAKLREADELFRHTQQDAARVLAETRAAAQREIDKLRARVTELEQAHVLIPPLATPPGARPRILIAHPDAELRMSARASLERAGYEIFSAADGLEALRTAIAERPAIVIADAVMPKMDGRELCQLLKSQEKTAHIRVVLLTRPNDAPPRGELPPDEILRKPVPLETLKATLAALLAR
jgi:CheY-like chemotaxis protein